MHVIVQFLDFNECESDPCVNGTCHDELNGYWCNCTEFFTGTNCETGKVCRSVIFN